MFFNILDVFVLIVEFFYQCHKHINTYIYIHYIYIIHYILLNISSKYMNVLYAMYIAQLIINT